MSIPENIHEYMKSLAPLKQQLKQCEKDRVKSLYSNKSLLREEFMCVEDYDNTLESARNTDIKHMHHSVLRIKREVSELTDKVSRFLDNTKQLGIKDNYDRLVTNLQRAVELVDSELRDFKDRSRREFESLQQEENALSKEIEDYSDKFDNWDAVSHTTKKNTQFYIKDRDREVTGHHKEIHKIEKEIQELGGITLGWDEADHVEFLKLKTKHKGKYTVGFLHAAKNLLPYHDEETIKEHFKHHEIYFKLNKKKKEIVEEWKRTKEVKKVHVEEKEDDLAEYTAIQTKSRTRPSSAHAKVKLEEWKKQKEEGKLQEMERKKGEERKIKEKEQTRKQEIERKKQIVNEYKERKELDKMQTELIDKYQKRRNTVELTDEDRDRLRQREEELFNKKLEKLNKKQRLQEDKEHKESLRKFKTQMAFSYVDSRLQQETTATIKRRECKQSENRIETYGGVLVHRPTRAIPMWRQGLSR